MANALSGIIERGSRESWRPAGGESWSDEALLGRFLDPEEPTAQECFQALIARHGPMVLGVCRHILGQVHDAEDAFQATFLILARSAGSIRDRRSLSHWLYEVAYRAAVQAKVRSARRRTREKEAAEMSAVSYHPENDPAWLELMPVLHDEVNRLPTKYRSAVVLCYLEGRTNEEAAELLQWPVGTVKGRLYKARELLRSRLTRRGLAISAAFLAMSLSRNTVFAEVVPSRLLEETARAGVVVLRTGRVEGASVSSSVLELVENVLREKFRRSVRSAVSAIALVAILAAFIGPNANFSGGRNLEPSFPNRPGVGLSANAGSGRTGECRLTRNRDRAASPGFAQ